MNRILLAVCLLVSAAAGVSLPGCVVHERDRVVEHDHHDYDHHDWDHDHGEHHEEIRVEEHH